MKTNLKNMAWMLAATLVMAACSDSLDESSGNGNSNEYVGNKGYVNIGINLPTTSSTRANDEFDDGKAEEYRVNNVIIALFYGSSGDAAKCKYAFKLTNADFNLSGTSTDNITSFYASGVRMIQAPTANEKVYALAIVNPTDYFNVSTTSDATNENDGDAVLTTVLQTQQSDGSSYATFDGKLSELNVAASISTIADVIGSNKNDFLMTNAPIANQPTYTYSATTIPTDFEVTTLAPVTVYNDKSVAANEAIHNPIYVERAVAKTQVKVSGDDATLTVKSSTPTYDGATVEFLGWKLQTTNNYYYPVRKVDGWNNWATFEPNTSPTYNSNRFFGNQAGPYRTYWGVDPNYETDLTISGTGPENYIIIDEDKNMTWNAIGDNSTTSAIEYCLENTTTAKTMEDNRLTSVLLKTTFTPINLETTGTSFFTINNTSAIYTESDFFKVASAALPDGEKLGTGESLVVKATTGMKADDATEVKDLLQIQTSTGTKDLTDKQANGILGAVSVINYYKDGITYYYTTVIRHFDETEAPLGDGSINNATDYEEDEHLGRYGVVRNNWYELDIKSVSGLGEPEIPTDGGGDNPPDKTASYINCEINVLSWTKRSQGVEL